MKSSKNMSQGERLDRQLARLGALLSRETQVKLKASTAKGNPYPSFSLLLPTRDAIAEMHQVFRSREGKNLASSTGVIQVHPRVDADSEIMDIVLQCGAITHLEAFIHSFASLYTNTASLAPLKELYLHSKEGVALDNQPHSNAAPALAFCPALESFSFDCVINLPQGDAFAAGPACTLKELQVGCKLRAKPLLDLISWILKKSEGHLQKLTFDPSPSQDVLDEILEKHGSSLIELNLGDGMIRRGNLVGLNLGKKCPKLEMFATAADPSSEFLWNLPQGLAGLAFKPSSKGNNWVGTADQGWVEKLHLAQMFFWGEDALQHRALESEPLEGPPEQEVIAEGRNGLRTGLKCIRELVLQRSPEALVKFVDSPDPESWPGAFPFVSTQCVLTEVIWTVQSLVLLIEKIFCSLERRM